MTSLKEYPFLEVQSAGRIRPGVEVPAGHDPRWLVPQAAWRRGRPRV